MLGLPRKKEQRVKLKLKNLKIQEYRYPMTMRERIYFILGFLTISKMQLKTNKPTNETNSVYKAEYIRMSSGSSGANLPLLSTTPFSR